MKRETRTSACVTCYKLTTQVFVAIHILDSIMAPKRATRKTNKSGGVSKRARTRNDLYEEVVVV